MVWPAMLFNLCIGLLFAAFLFRAVRRFECRADGIMAKLDRDEQLSSQKWDLARDEIRASMHIQTDMAIESMRVTIEKFGAMVDTVNLEVTNDNTSPQIVSSDAHSGSESLNGSKASKLESLDKV
jgi:hypothetical protein